ncbi:uncharacterized protein HKW66_Vig0193720 [Vigna angularis]|uniref:Hydroxyproline-rich glycoprotein family protein n=2 Tax=Phaseolus angularis TaxID=3914 RepID=A0A8T0KR53_PHAAN|nr:uncharacterized protein LOC108324052 [Vigna angularis]KAG2401592.1 uncharacterized protein HKW66_Vig0193720 [Vigna angularis]BAT94241.1 hypothetical protein VIGAN_08082500 [Vigna angularis var. angularis]
MGTVNNTVNAAASAIVVAESRIQPASSPKKRWGSCWSLYWCFGPHKNNKRIGNAVLVPEPVEPVGQVGSHPATAAPNPSTAVVMPFVVPPSSPASFLESDPPSATQSPVGLFSLSSLNVNASGGPASIFAIGPYTYETQLVSPPVFSNFTTEPSTAPFTPPPESVQLTTPSSPEVPFAQLLESSLDQDCKNKGTNQRFALSNYEFQLYQQYPGSPGTQLISPGSIISTSGSSTPFPDRHPLLEFHKGEASNLLGFEHFSTHKWNSRLGSGSLTPDSTGQGSGLGSGSLTPNVVKPASQLGSGCLTPDGAAPTAAKDIYVGKPISELTSLANSKDEGQPNAALVDHRVSFELTGEDVARCLPNKSGSPLIGNISGSSEDALLGEPVDRESIHCDLCSRKTSNDKPENSPREGEEHCNSSKEFNFDSRKGVVSDNPANASEWWTNKKMVGKESRSSNVPAFFPMLQSEVV